jgi:nitrogen regulation protein NR(I)
MSKILIVDDETGVRHSFKKILGRQGYDVITAENGKDAIEKVSIENPSLVFMDVSMPEMDGIETLQKLKSIHPDLPVIMMTAFSSSDKAITAMKYGAYDYLTKPFDNAQITSLIKKAMAEIKKPAVQAIHDIMDDKGDRIIGRSPAMLDIFKKIGQVAASNVNVLLLGETGTGKEKIAKAIYRYSDRAGKIFLPVNCAAIPDTLLESELFGHERGAFTGAGSRKTGKFEQCSNGTMFLDEIGDMPISLQAKLLRVLQDGCFQRLGGKDIIQTDVRIIAATNQNLEKLVACGKFRDDLYWRLNVVSINVPPLRERTGDINDLVKHFINRFNHELGRQIKGASSELVQKFMGYHWPGNIRELRSVIQRGMVLCQKELLDSRDCEWSPRPARSLPSADDMENLLSGTVNEIIASSGAETYKDAVAAFERLFVQKALELTGNNQVLAAKLLGISRNTLRAKLGKD